MRAAIFCYEDVLEPFGGNLPGASGTFPEQDTFLFLNPHIIRISDTTGVTGVLDINNAYFTLFSNGELANSGPTTSQSALIASLCPNGVDRTGVIHFARTPAEARATASTFGQAAGAYAYGDFNRDGVMDSAALTPSGVIVTLFQASGAVLSSATYKVGSTETGIVAADFNGDGALDLALILDPDASGQGSVAVLLGKGDGTFGAPVKYPAGTQPNALALGDFNSDGKLDLAVANLHGQVAVLAGKADGTFAAAVSYPVGQTLFSIVAADLNGNGKLDLAVLDTQDATGDKIWVMPGKGDGTFGNPTGTVTNTAVGSLAYTDLNHDGKTDLLIADPGTSGIAVLSGNGDGTFQPVKVYVAAAQGIPASVAVAPLADGKTALFTGDGITGNILAIFAAADGTISTASIEFIGQNPSSIAAADLNGDQQLDLVIVDKGAASLYVLQNAGKGTFGSPATYALGSNPAALALADMNHDGKPDAVVAEANGIDVLLGKGDGTFGPMQAFASGGQLNSLAIADFNGDGKLDVAATNAGTGGLSLFLGNGDGTFRSATAIALPSGAAPLAVAAGDLNGDAKPDLVASFNGQDPFTTPGTISILLGSADGAFQAPNNIVLPGPLILSSAIAVADIDGDGKLDVVAAIHTNSGNQLAVLLGKGDGTFQAPKLTNIRASAPTIAVGDLNGDGIADLVLGDCCGLNEASYLLGVGDGSFQSEVLFPSGPSPSGIAISDLDGNGKPDLAIVGQVGRLQRGTLVLLANTFPNSSAIVSAANRSAKALAPNSLAVAYGTDLANSNAGGTPLPLPTNFGGTSIGIVDATGKTSAALLLYVSRKQVNFRVPADVATGAAQVIISSGDGTTSIANVQIAPVAPGLFEADSTGLAAGYVVLYHADNTQTVEQLFTVSSAGVISDAPISLGSTTDRAFLFLFGTGIEAAGATGVKVSVGGSNAPVSFAGPQGQFVGVDQVNVQLPATLKDKGNVTIQLTANGIAANPVNITIQ